MIVQEAIKNVIADLPAIGKDSYNEQQGFAFRGIDAVVTALKPLLAKHGVILVPDVTERIYAQRPTRNGGVMHEVNLHITYRIYGPEGDCIMASGWGEGTDSGDKATNKAMTAAYKYVLFQLFAIADAAADGDAHTPAETVGHTPEWETLGYDSEQQLIDAVDDIKDLWEKVSLDEVKTEIKTWLKERGYSARWPVQRQHLAIYLDALMEAESR